MVFPDGNGMTDTLLMVFSEKITCQQPRRSFKSCLLSIWYYGFPQSREHVLL
jgi:hypothetical protein